MLTIKDLAEIVGVSPFYMKNYLYTHYCPLAEKRYVYFTVTSNKTGKKWQNKKQMYVVSEDKLQEFLSWWKKRPIGRLVSPTVSEGGTRLTWSKTAIECFEAKFYCKRCVNYTVCELIKKQIVVPKGNLCPIKQFVLDVYSRIGAPPERILEND